MVKGDEMNTNLFIIISTIFFVVAITIFIRFLAKNNKAFYNFFNSKNFIISWCIGIFLVPLTIAIFSSGSLIKALRIYEKRQIYLILFVFFLIFLVYYFINKKTLEYQEEDFRGFNKKKITKIIMYILSIFISMVFNLLNFIFIVCFIDIIYKIKIR